MLGAGRFRVALAEPLQEYAGFHVTFHADHYEEAEHHTPCITQGKDFDDVVIKLKRRKITVEANKVKVGEGLRGKVVHEGKPVASGLVTLCYRNREMNLVNGYVLRGRVTTAPYLEVATAAIEQGQYELPASQAGQYFLTVYVPGQAPFLSSHVSVQSGEWKQFDLETQASGSIAGKVQDLPVESQGYLWVVAFSKKGYRAEVPVRADGTFQFPALPAGEYGLKVGHDAIRDRDAEVRFPAKPDKQAFEEYQKKAEAPSNPWLRVKEVKLETGQAVKDVVLEVPEEMKPGKK
jgi:hypothetical protein